MSKLPENRYDETPLDEEEVELADMIKQGLLSPNKNKSVTLRVQEADLNKIKLEATMLGIPYQTLISSLLHRYATGQLKADFS
jgi:predicted DNA binding CopG/RHH family protein